MIAMKLDHLAVTVRDMERSLEFYRDLLGMKEVGTHDLEGETISTMAGKDKVRMRVVRLVCPDTPGIMIDLQQYLEPEGGRPTASSAISPTAISALRSTTSTPPTRN